MSHLFAPAMRAQLSPAGARLQQGVRCLLLCACLTLAACGGGPESTAEAWLDALNSGDLSQALELSTDPTKALLNIGSSMGEDLAVGDYEIVSVKEISGTRAEVVILADIGETTLDLVKIDGEWKVGFQK